MMSLESLAPDIGLALPQEVVGNHLVRIETESADKCLPRWAERFLGHSCCTSVGISQPTAFRWTKGER